MINLKTKLALFNLLSKLGIAIVFIVFLPWLVERINLRQVDNDLVQKREKTIRLISEIGIEPFMSSDSIYSFGSYNILKEEFISLEKTDTIPDLNYINVTDRIIDNERITYRVLNYTLLIDGTKYLLETGKSIESIRNSRKSITGIMLLFMIFVILITFFADLQYTSFVLRPLKKITHKLKGISTPSTFDMSPVKTNTSDFYKLDGVLRELMTKIGESFRKEREITINISHELLTPVSVIRSKLENILLKESVDHETSARIEESLKTLHRLQSLVNSLLLIARLESNQYQAEDSFSIKELLNEIVEEIKPVADDKGVSVAEKYNYGFLYEKANRSLIFSMFYNIINNAVKNTSAGGKVIISDGMVKSRYRITIADTGRGMNEEQLGDLFSRFSAKRGNENNGTGIGLAIAKSIADFHKIIIGVVSEPGKGTQFSFLFPENS